MSPFARMILDSQPDVLKSYLLLASGKSPNNSNENIIDAFFNDGIDQGS